MKQFLECGFCLLIALGTICLVNRVESLGRLIKPKP